ncbi:MAG: hypothetical protein DSY80_10880 [Desulfocapsa sp.]|nr:MAG: hypothetical protein DSY80_10880 [Desulfocapsa sp.]
MKEENELERLEGFVSTLLDKFNALQGKNKELNERIQRRDVSIVRLEDELISMKDERGEISSRVSGLIGKIEEWESATADVEVVSEDEKEEDTTESESETEENKKDSGVQGNLFSVEATGE